MEQFKEKIDLINKAKPELVIKSINIITSGYHSVAIVINNQYIFRFPLKSEFFAEYIEENKILNIIRPLVSLSVPKLTVHDIDGYIFTEHVLIIGEQYSKISTKLNNVQRDKFSDDLSKFVFELHKIKAYDTNISQFNADDYCLKSNISVVHEYLKDETKIKKFNDVIFDFEKENKLLKEENIVLCHNDLNENNILLNNQTLELSGIIDFGNSVKRDFSSEFASLMKYDCQIVIDIAKKYEILSGRKVNLKYASLIQKIRCYGGILEHIIGEKNIERMQCYNKWLENLEKYDFN